jgi:hypothetical protein
MQCKHYLLAILAMWGLMLSPAFAGKSTLSLIRFPVSAEIWVKTQTPLVTVAVAASVKPQEVASFSGQVSKRLNQLAKADWRVTQFNRSQDQSGLEKIELLAQARLSEAALSEVSNRIKTISESGQQYQLNDIQYTPTLVELEQAHAQLRAQIYALAKAEEKKLANAFSGQHYRIYQIEFLPEFPLRSGQVLPSVGLLRMNSVSVSDTAAETNRSPLAVDQKVSQQAWISYAEEMHS